MGKVSKALDICGNNLLFFTCLYLLFSIFAFMLRHLIDLDFILVIVGLLLLVILFNKKPSFFIKYLFVIFMCFFMLIGLFICEHFNIRLFELGTNSGYHGSFSVAIFYWTILIAVMVHFDKKYSFKYKYDDNREVLFKLISLVHLDRLFSFLPVRFRKNNAIILLSLIIYLFFFVIGLIVLLYVLFNLPAFANLDRFGYERILPVWVKKIQTYYIYFVPLLFLPLALSKKKLDLRHLLMIFISLFPFALYCILVGNKFGIFFNVFTLLLISLVVYILNNDILYKFKSNNTISFNNTRETNFSNNIIKLLALTFIAMILFLTPYYVIRRSNMTDAIFSRVAQQGQLWWSIFEKNESGQMHVSELQDEFLPLFNANSVEETDYNHGVYKIMNLTTPANLVKSKLETGSRYSCQGIELAFYYFGYIGVIIHAIIRGMMEVLLVILLIKYLYSLRVISTVITTRLLMLCHTVFSQGDWFLVFSYKTIFTIVLLAGLSYLYNKYRNRFFKKELVTKKKPLISVIVPVYNQEKYLKSCLESIINQTYSNLEIIVVNDGSTDSTLDILNEYASKDSRIIVLNKENGGVSAARNTGIRKSTGEYIAFVDSDDWIHPQMYEYLYFLIKEYNADISSCSFGNRIEKSIIDYNQYDFITVFEKNEYLYKYFKLECQDTEYYPWNKLYRRELIDNNQFPVGIACGEDVFGTYKSVARAYSIVKSSKKLYYYRENADSVSRNFSKKDYDVIKVWDLMVNYNEKISSEYFEYSLLNRKRANFTILYRLAKNYNVEDLKKMTIVKKLLSELKKDELYLLESKIVFSRKVIIFLFCRNYYFWARFL